MEKANSSLDSSNACSKLTATGSGFFKVGLRLGRGDFAFVLLIFGDITDSLLTGGTGVFCTSKSSFLFLLSKI